MNTSYSSARGILPGDELGSGGPGGLVDGSAPTTWVRSRPQETTQIDAIDDSVLQRGHERAAKRAASLAGAARSPFDNADDLAFQSHDEPAGRHESISTPSRCTSLAHALGFGTLPGRMERTCQWH